MPMALPGKGMKMYWGMLWGALFVRVSAEAVGQGSHTFRLRGENGVVVFDTLLLGRDPCGIDCIDTVTVYYRGQPFQEYGLPPPPPSAMFDMGWGSYSVLLRRI
jgi:hypothetical protein